MTIIEKQISISNDYKEVKKYVMEKPILGCRKNDGRLLGR